MMVTRSSLFQRLDQVRHQPNIFQAVENEIKGTGKCMYTMVPFFCFRCFPFSFLSSTGGQSLSSLSVVINWDQVVCRYIYHFTHQYICGCIRVCICTVHVCLCTYVQLYICTCVLYVV